MEQFTNEIKDFAAIILAGQDNDATKATGFMNRLNQLLTENPGIVKVLGDPATEKKVRKVLPVIKNLI